MEVRANYFWVGFFVIILTLGILVFGIWLKGFEIYDTDKRYIVYFNQSVSGVSPGTSVRVKGVNLGKVEQVKIEPGEAERVMIIIRLPRDVAIKTDSIASIEMLGFAGSKFILISEGTNAAPEVKAENGELYPVLQAKRSPIDDAINMVPKVLGNIDVLVASLNKFASPDNQKNFSNLVKNISEISETIAKQKEAISGIITNSGELVVNLKEASDKAKNAFVAVEGAAGQVKELLEENRDSLRDFSSSGLYELTGLLTEFRELSTGLNRVVTRIESNPTQFLFGGSKKSGVKAE